MNKYVFLDFDGVLNSTRNAYAFQQKAFNADGLDHTCLKLVEDLCQRSGAEVVVSSTWRMGRTEDWFRGLFAAYGVKITIAGMTPRLRSDLRGDEVKAWLSDKGECLYVCIDDDSDFHDDQPLIKTSHEIGFTHRDMESALQMLGCHDEVNAIRSGAA